MSHDEGGTTPARVSTFRLPTLDAYVHRLEVLDDAGEARRMVEARAPSATLGSAATNDVVLDDPTVSRHHCAIHVEGGSPWIRDLDSKNGTRVDGVEVREARLEPGCVLQLGELRARYRCERSSAPLYPADTTSFGELYGAAPAMRRLFGLLERVGQTSLTVLLLGETGTGKELAARALHDHSERREGPFVTVDCGAVNAELVDSQLFGHEAGAFTGAARSHVGAFVRAQGGTVFLDEIGELPPPLQPKLLRALERREVVPLGAQAPVSLDVRVIAATHRDLAARVAEGTFRADLYYRLAEVEVPLPALRERASDIPELARRLAERPARWSDAALEYLERRPWPGNVRELRNLVRRVTALADGPIDLALVERMDANPPPPAPPPAEKSALELPLHLDGPLADARKRWLEALEPAYLRAILAHAGGDLDRAAAHIGVHRKSVQRLMRQYDLEPPD
jgi:DNA-binding NtrC family response regulator